MNKKDNAFLFCESAKNKWKFKIAAYPDYLKRNNQKLLKLLDRCKNKGIPTASVGWATCCPRCFM